MILLQNVHWDKVAELLGTPLITPSRINCANCRKSATVVVDLSLRIPVVFCKYCQMQWDVFSYLSLLYLGQIPEYGSIHEHLQKQGILDEAFDMVEFIMQIAHHKTAHSAHQQMLSDAETRAAKSGQIYQLFELNASPLLQSQLIRDLIPTIIQDIPQTIGKEALNGLASDSPCLLIPAWSSFMGISGYVCLLPESWRSLYLPVNGIPPVYGIPNFHAFFDYGKRRSDNSLLGITIDPRVYAEAIARNLLKGAQPPAITLICEARAIVDGHWKALDFPPLLLGTREPYLLVPTGKASPLLLAVAKQYRVTGARTVHPGSQSFSAMRDIKLILEDMTIDDAGYDLQTAYLNKKGTPMLGYRLQSTRCWTRSGVWSNKIVTTSSTGIYYNEKQVTNYHAEVAAVIGQRHYAVTVVHEQQQFDLIVPIAKFVSDAHQAIIKSLPHLAGIISCVKRYRKHLSEIILALSDPEILPALPGFTKHGFRTATSLISYSGKVSPARKLACPYSTMTEKPGKRKLNDTGKLLAFMTLAHKYDASCYPVVGYDAKTCTLLRYALEQIKAPILTASTAQSLANRRAKLIDMHWPMGIIWRGDKDEFLLAHKHMHNAVVLWPEARRFVKRLPISVFVAKEGEYNSFANVVPQFYSSLYSGIVGNLVVSSPFIHSTYNRRSVSNVFTLVGDWTDARKYSINVIDYYMMLGNEPLTAMKKALPLLRRAVENDVRLFKSQYRKVKMAIAELEARQSGHEQS